MLEYYLIIVVYIKIVITSIVVHIYIFFLLFHFVGHAITESTCNNKMAKCRRNTNLPLWRVHSLLYTLLHLARGFFFFFSKKSTSYTTFSCKNQMVYCMCAAAALVLTINFSETDSLSLVCCTRWSLHSVWLEYRHCCVIYDIYIFLKSCGCSPTSFRINYTDSSRFAFCISTIFCVTDVYATSCVILWSVL